MQIRKQTGSDTYVVLDDTTIYEMDMNCRREGRDGGEQVPHVAGSARGGDRELR